MPKQIKKEEIEKGEVAHRIAAIVTMGLDLIFAALLIFVLPRLLEDESPVKACVITAGYALFTVGCIVHCAIALTSYGKTQNASGLLQGLLSLAAAFMCLLNLRFMLALMFSGLKMEEAADKIVGDHTMTEFIQLQSSNWICLIFAMAIMLIIGILGIVRLAKR